MNWFFNLKKKTPIFSPLELHVKDAVEKSGLFDSDWYVKRYPDVAASGVGALDHFCKNGIHEHRDPGPGFDTRAYLYKYPDAQKANEPPLLHAINNPSFLTAKATTHTLEFPHQVIEPTLAELLQRSGLFDDNWYLKTYRDVVRAGVNPFEHFIGYGAVELRNPGPEFESSFYAEKYPECAKLYPSPIEHYLRVGQFLGNARKGPSPYQRWIHRFDTLSKADKEFIQSDIKSLCLPPLRLIYIFNREACNVYDTLLGALSGSLLQNWSAYIIPAEGLDVTIWLDLCSKENTDPRIQFFPSTDRFTELDVKRELTVYCVGSVILREHSLYMLAKTALQMESDIIYTDHDHFNSENERENPVFKPEVSPEYLRQSPYIGPLIAVRTPPGSIERVRDLIENCCREGILPLSRHVSKYISRFGRDKITHLPFVLYHVMRDSDKKVTSKLDDQDTSSFDEVALNGHREHMDVIRNSYGGKAIRAETGIEHLPTVSILIPTRDRLELIRGCVDSILEKTTYPTNKYQIVVIDNDSKDPETINYMTHISRIPNCTIVKAPGPFNFSKINNIGVAQSSGDVLVFLNNDTTIRQSDWLEQIVSYCMQDDVGAVGAKLLYPDETIQHGGTVLGVQGVGAHLLVGVPIDSDEANDVTRELSCVTGACLGIRRTVFDKVGMFDPVLQVAFNDVKLCMKCMEAGYRNIYISDPLLYHFESKSRGFDDTAEKSEQNRREAIYVRRAFSGLFQNDPFYSPNLSLERVGEIAFPPRAVRPWLASRQGAKHVMLLSCVHQQGHGVPCVLQLQAAHLRERGWDVTIGGPKGSNEFEYPGCQRTYLNHPAEAAAYAIENGVDCIIVHTPPFFSIVRWLGNQPTVYFIDHGEPPPEFFEDRQEREAINLEKRFCAPLAKRIFVISETVKNQVFHNNATVLRNGNSHLAVWSDEWRTVRKYLRKKMGLENKFVILNVCRFEEKERAYKGVDAYIKIMKEVPYIYPELNDVATFVIAGKAQPTDVDAIERVGLRTFANISDTEMKELYAVSDLYLNMSRWEGYNLGIGQALAMGLPVIASNIDAHREFPINTFNDPVSIINKIRELYAAWVTVPEKRTPVVFHWNQQLKVLGDLIEKDLDHHSPVRCLS